MKIKRGLYRLASVSVDDELEEVSHIVPDGVVCLFSAWNYYQLSDFVPPEYHIAIEKTRKVVLPDYPPIKVYYWSEKYWSIGITVARIGNTIVKIYDREKAEHYLSFISYYRKDSKNSLANIHQSTPQIWGFLQIGRRKSYGAEYCLGG